MPRISRVASRGGFFTEALRRSVHRGRQYGSDHWTRRDTVTHSAGFDRRRIGTLSRSVANRPTLREHLSDRMPPRVRPPATVISYSNYGMALAGYVVETVSRQPFAKYVRQHILLPLEMHRSSFEAPLGDAGDLAVGRYIGGDTDTVSVVLKSAGVQLLK